MVDRRGLAATMLAGLLFGTSVPVIKLGLNFIPPNTFVALRFSFASALIALLLRRQGWVQRDLFKSREIWIIGFINALGYVLQFQGQLITSSSDRKSTRLNSSHVRISYAVFCLKKKKNQKHY